jgi:hypothetical protein
MAFPAILNWLDAALFGYQTIANNGVAMPTRSALNFVGFNVVDDPELGSTDVISAAGAAVWTVDNDTDFSTFGTTALATDGNYTFNGTIWTRGNASNDRVAMTTNAGTGLVIAPAISVVFEPPTVTAPFLSLPLTSVIPNFGLTTPFRMTWYRESGNESTTSLGSDISSAAIYSPTTHTFHQVGHSFDSNIGSPSSYINSSIDGASGETNEETNLSSYNVFRAEFPMGLASSWVVFSCSTYAGDWPADDTFVTAYLALPAGSLNTGGVWSKIGSVADYAMILSAERRSGSPTNLAVTFGRTRVEHR